MGGGAWQFLVGGLACLVNSGNERDLRCTSASHGKSSRAGGKNPRVEEFGNFEVPLVRGGFHPSEMRTGSALRFALRFARSYYVSWAYGI